MENWKLFRFAANSSSIAYVCFFLLAWKVEEEDEVEIQEILLGFMFYYRFFVYLYLL